MSHIAPTAQIFDSSIADVNLYKGVTVKGCTLSDGVSVGDYSQVVDSRLAVHVRLQRNNAIYLSTIGRRSYTGRNTTVWKSEIGAFCCISWNVSIGGGGA